MRLLPKSLFGKICVAVAIVFVFVAGFLSWGPHVQSAQPQTWSTAENGENNEQQATDVNMGAMLFRTLLSLVIVFGILYLVVFGLKKMMGQKRSGRNSAIALNVIGSTFLGPKKAVYLVQVADRVLILGVTDSQVSMLSEISDEETLKTLKPLQNAQKNTTTSFSEHLNAMLKGIRRNDG